MSEKEIHSVDVTEAATEATFVKTGSDRVDTTDSNWDGGSVFSGSNKAGQKTERPVDSKDYELKGIRASKREPVDTESEEEELSLPLFWVVGGVGLLTLLMGVLALWALGLL